MCKYIYVGNKWVCYAPNKPCERNFGCLCLCWWAVWTNRSSLGLNAAEDLTSTLNAFFFVFELVLVYFHGLAAPLGLQCTLHIFWLSSRAGPQGHSGVGSKAHSRSTLGQQCRNSPWNTRMGLSHVLEHGDSMMVVGRTVLAVLAQLCCSQGGLSRGCCPTLSWGLLLYLVL